MRDEDDYVYGDDSPEGRAASNNILTWWIVGVLSSLVGCVFLFVGLGGTSENDETNTVGLVGGVVGLGVGLILLLLAVIATGVKTGILATRRDISDSE